MDDRLSHDEVARYSRQMLCSELGKQGQLKLKAGSILVVGAGGLGCPCAIYLVAAGIGRLGVVDNDCVEASNLHRQILHSERTRGVSKVDSAVERLEQLNSNVIFEKHKVRLSKDNAFEIVKNYDVIIDGTDNPMARYLLNDVCVLLHKPLVSGSALRFEGQLTVYNYGADCPCYRCIFPQPPPAGTVTNCADGGVIGVVPGIIGNLQAMEAIKIVSGIGPSYAGTLLLYDGLSGKFRSVVLRKKKLDCISCGTNRTITPELMDYSEFCGIQCGLPVNILDSTERATAEEYHQLLQSNEPHLLIDVRPMEHQNIVKLEHAHSIPLNQILEGNGVEKVKELIEKHNQNKSVKKIFVMCRRGFTSQQAVRVLKTGLEKNFNQLEIRDLIGGIQKWCLDIDNTIPMY